MGGMSSAPPEQALCHLPDFAALDAPTHARVIHVWELAGLPPARALAAFTTVRDADTTEELDALAERLAPSWRPTRTPSR